MGHFCYSLQQTGNNLKAKYHPETEACPNQHNVIWVPSLAYMYHKCKYSEAETFIICGTNQVSGHISAIMWLNVKDPENPKFS